MARVLITQAISQLVHAMAEHNVKIKSIELADFYSEAAFKHALNPRDPHVAADPKALPAGAFASIYGVEIHGVRDEA